jgi:hypothetical protein
VQFFVEFADLLVQRAFEVLHTLVVLEVGEEAGEGGFGILIRGFEDDNHNLWLQSSLISGKFALSPKMCPSRYPRLSPSKRFWAQEVGDDVGLKSELTCIDEDMRDQDIEAQFMMLLDQMASGEMNNAKVVYLSAMYTTLRSMGIPMPNQHGNHHWREAGPFAISLCPGVPGDALVHQSGRKNSIEI